MKRTSGFGGKWFVAVVLASSVLWCEQASAQGTMQQLIQEASTRPPPGQTATYRGYTVDGRVFKTWGEALHYWQSWNWSLGTDSLFGSGPMNFNYGQQLGVGISLSSVLTNVGRETYACGQRHGSMFEVPFGRIPVSVSSGLRSGLSWAAAR
jgi:hypothetical protein